MKESYVRIRGGKCLKGFVRTSGAKNSTLPLLFSTLLAKGTHEFHNVPRLKDVDATLQLLKSLGLSFKKEEDKIQIVNYGEVGTIPATDSVRSMRASILCLGPLLTKFKKAQLPFPGGCVIGSRPIDLHIKALKTLGASIKEEDSFIIAEAPKGLKGNSIHFDFPTVGGTENILLASVLAKGKTKISNAACEPEILDLIIYLNSMGACITRVSEREFSIEGVSLLKPKSPHVVIPDRIEAGTLLLAGAMTFGEVEVTHCNPQDLTFFIKKLEETGCSLQIAPHSLSIKSKSSLKAVNIETRVYPGFPTDLQAQFMAYMTQLEGESHIKETIFEKRFKHVEELRKLRAEITLGAHQMASIKGPVSLKGANIQATDLRASAGLILGGLVAEGETKVFKVYHLQRGYENLPFKLQSLGADISLIN